MIETQRMTFVRIVLFTLINLREGKYYYEITFHHTPFGVSVDCSNQEVLSNAVSIY